MTWLYVPETSSPSARESEDWNSEFSSPSHIGERLAGGSVTWRGKQQPPQAWSRRWKQGGFIRLLSGLTCSPSTLDHGVASFISSLQATHAKTTASQESGQEQMESGSSPRKSAALPKSAGLILSSAKTYRGTRTDSLQLSSRHWKGWAIALRQEYSARPRPVTPCGASDCSSWPSPMAGAAGTEAYNAAGNSDFSRKAMEQAEKLLDWAAPCARDHFPPHTPEYIASKKAEGHGMRNLTDEAANWSSPKASDPEKAGPNMRGSKGDVPLPGQAVNWEAPSVAVTDGSRLTRGGDRSDELLLTGQAIKLAKKMAAAAWPAPAARDHKGANSATHLEVSTGSMHLNQLPNFVEHCFLPPSSLDRPIAGGSMSLTDSPNSNQPSVKRKLNPIFVEALMRWPTGLSGFERQEMALTRWSLQQLSFLSALYSVPEEAAKQMEMF